ncbi:REP-associated tyrosine transposase [Alienimonas chondri]|uniref:Transposase IS200-like domain-containing protein n=1 Tax=Alienimonas chondri TaxID=2681879 RepID=A0ABX1VAS1_9PLAN|nr:hypothetical protein [Alienimonas chondri]
MQTTTVDLVRYPVDSRPIERNDALIAERVRRGLPWHAPPHPDCEGGWFLITAACYRHRRHFSAPAELTALTRRLQEAVANAGWNCGGWVVLTNHYHLMVNVPSLEPVGAALGRVHGRSARYANERDGTPGRRVWYRYCDRRIRSERHFATCLHYLFLNPVKHRYVDDPQEWRWSSLHE